MRQGISCAYLLLSLLGTELYQNGRIINLLETFSAAFFMVKVMGK
jgi:hypothetical protein